MRAGWLQTGKPSPDRRHLTGIHIGKHLIWDAGTRKRMQHGAVLGEIRLSRTPIRRFHCVPSETLGVTNISVTGEAGVWTPALAGPPPSMA